MRITRRQFTRLAAATAALGCRSLFAAGEKPITKAIPSTGECIPAIGLGTNRYAIGDAADNAALLDTLATFADHGGEVIDTAPMYRTSETILGRLIEQLGCRDDLFIATKSDRPADDGGIERLEASFDNLRVDTIDLMQSHNLRGAESMLPILDEYRQEGRIRYVGVTTSREAQFDDVIGWMERRPLDFVQVNYSLADREAEKRILPLAADQGMAVLVNLPLGRGRLFDAVERLALPDWTRAFGCESWAQFFLKYVISHPAVTCAIPGMTKAKHAVDNLGALRGRLPEPAERRRMEAFFANL